jgi:transposase-like protein
MTKSRKKFDAAFKARIALEALLEVATVPDLAKRHGVGARALRIQLGRVLEMAESSQSDSELKGSWSCLPRRAFRHQK